MLVILLAFVIMKKKYKKIVGWDLWSVLFEFEVAFSRAYFTNRLGCSGLCPVRF